MRAQIEDSANGIHALYARSREIAADEREEAVVLIRQCGYALYCGGKGAPAVRCDNVAAFEAAQRGCWSGIAAPLVPYTHAETDTERAP